MQQKRQRSLPSIDFTEKRLAALPPAVRFTAAGMRMHVDDEGRCKLDLRLILSTIYRHDPQMHEDELQSHLQQLIQSGWLHAYQAPDGEWLAQVVPWPAVQHAKPSPLAAPQNLPQSAAPVTPTSEHTAAAAAPKQTPPPVMQQTSQTAEPESLQVTAEPVAVNTALVDPQPSVNGELTPEQVQKLQAEFYRQQAKRTPAQASQSRQVLASPFCAKHQPYGTELACGPCRTARYSYEMLREDPHAVRVPLSAPDMNRDEADESDEEFSTELETTAATATAAQQGAAHSRRPQFPAEPETVAQDGWEPF